MSELMVSFRRSAAFVNGRHDTATADFLNTFTCFDGISLCRVRWRRPNCNGREAEREAEGFFSGLLGENDVI